MHFKFFIQADQEKEALAVYDECMQEIDKYITEKSDFVIEKYWKFPDSYTVELEFKWSITQEQFLHFLDSICNSWDVLGDDEMLGSAASKYTQFIKDQVELFIINMEEDEKWLIADNIEGMPGYDTYYEDGEWGYRRR